MRTYTNHDIEIQNIYFPEISKYDNKYNFIVAVQIDRKREINYLYIDAYSNVHCTHFTNNINENIQSNRDLCILK